MEVDRKDDMEPAAATKYRGLAARMNFLAIDRGDLQYASKEGCKHMSNPKNGDWEVIKRAGRYLRGKPRSVQLFPFENVCRKLTGYADSDWAGDKVTLKSTSGGALFLGQSMIKSWSTSQTIVALSSGEAELYSLTKLASQTVGMISLASDFGVSLTGEIKSDSSAAIGIASRTGLGGRARHIKVQFLWIQGCIKDGDLMLSKVHTTKNVADALTKYLGREAFEMHVKTMGYTFPEGRADGARGLQALQSSSNFKARGGTRDEPLNNVSPRRTVLHVAEKGLELDRRSKA
jgi:hypothetical protein